MSQQIAQTLSIQKQFVAPRMRVIETGQKNRRLRNLIAPGLLFVTLLAQISIRVEIVEKGYQLEQLRESALKADSSLRQLKLDLAVATRPSDLTNSAQKSLDLLPVNPNHVRAMLEEQ